MKKQLSLFPSAPIGMHVIVTTICVPTCEVCGHDANPLMLAICIDPTCKCGRCIYDDSFDLTEISTRISEALDTFPDHRAVSLTSDGYVTLRMVVKR